MIIEGVIVMMMMIWMMETPSKHLNIWMKIIERTKVTRMMRMMGTHV